MRQHLALRKAGTRNRSELFGEARSPPATDRLRISPAPCASTLCSRRTLQRARPAPSSRSSPEHAPRGTRTRWATATPDEQLWFGIFRLGAWPNFYPGVQFSRDPEALNQFFRQMVPNTGPYDAQINTEAVSALFNKIGPGILITHSQSGGLG